MNLNMLQEKTPKIQLDIEQLGRNEEKGKLAILDQ
jgi:hypothetical protein